MPTIFWKASRSYPTSAFSGSGGWLGPPLSEAWEQVFDDSGLSHVLDGPDATQLLTPQIAAAFELLDQALRDVDLSQPPDQLLTDPSLTIVRVTAARALGLVREQLAE